MDTKMQILNLIALFFIPILAVVIGHYLQDRAQKRADKMRVFTALMNSRLYGWTSDSVLSLNMLNFIFADNPCVKKRWKQYYEALCIQNPNQQEQIHIQKAQNKLLKAIAKSLGYKGKSYMESIEHLYKPIGMDMLQQQQAAYQGGILDFLNKIKQSQPPFPNRESQGQKTK